MRASVTVSMALLTSGVRNLSDRVSWVDVSTSEGTTSEADGTSSTSSKVRPIGAKGSGTLGCSMDQI